MSAPPPVVFADRAPEPELTAVPTPDPDTHLGSRRRSMADLAATALRIVTWTFANLTFLLGAWVLLASLLGGWQPIVVTSDSMQPTLRAGDVVLVEDDPIVGQRDVIVFERAPSDGDTDGGLVAHRVFAVEDDYVVTKGDANAGPDTDPVTSDDIVGTARLVVPFVGLPVVWAQTGQWLPLVAWGLITGAGVVLTALAIERSLRRRERRAAVEQAPSIARVGIQRIRVLTAVLIAGQLLVAHGVALDLGDPEVFASIGAIVVLFVTNAFGVMRHRLGGHDRFDALVELALDTMLVVWLTTATDNGISWILFALPIIEAAVRFRLVGALIHWMLLAGATLTIELWAMPEGSSASAISSLEARLEQLSVLFLFVIPAAYLSEQLLGELSTWQRVTSKAIGRSDLLAVVADVGRDILRLDGGHVPAVVEGLRSLGFDRADAVVEGADGRWQVLHGDDLPEPGAPGSATRGDDLHVAAAIVTDADDDDDAAALVEAGLSTVLSHVVSDHNGRRLVLRAGLLAGDAIDVERIEAFRLLAGQAKIALQNDQLLTEITSMHDELEHRALHDELTGLPNRALLLRRLREASAAGENAAILFLDLDGFKPVNDRLGHDAGDVLLQRVAARLLGAAPDGALVARLGGDEFTLLLTGLQVNSAESTARSIVDTIATPFDIGEQVVTIATSVGVAAGSADVDDAEMIRRADVAMYEAKHGLGGSTVSWYRPELDEHAERRARLAIDIATAIATDSLDLVFQPIVDVSDGERIVGAESLLRWEHPAFGHIAPGEAIDAALAAHQSESLNRFIVRHATEWLALVHRVTRNTDFFVTVNASPEELGTAALARNVAASAERAQVPPASIAVEISERVVTPVTEIAQRNMRQLRDMGVRLLLDDFGEGTTSLAHLQELPIDGVKLDRRLVVNSLRSRTDRLVLESIVKLSNRIGHRVIAEGIENDAHLAEVVAAGCELVQGYHLHRPLGGDDLLSILCDQHRDPAAGGTVWDRPTWTDAEGDRSAGVEAAPDWTTPLVSPMPMADAAMLTSASLPPPMIPQRQQSRSS